MTTDEITVPLSIISKLCDNLERDEIRRWDDIGRPKNDGYIHGSHSGYSRALRDVRRLMQYIEFANRACEK